MRSRKIIIGAKAVLSSLPIWVGVIIIIFSVVLWHAQVQENNREVEGMIKIQLRHVYNTVRYDIERQQFVPFKNRLPDLLGGDHYYGISMRIYRNQQLIFSKGREAKTLLQRWGMQQKFVDNGHRWQLTVWPGKVILEDYKTYLPDFTLSMGLIVGVLLIIIGLLAILATKREQAIQRAEWKLRRESSEKQKLQKVLQQNQKLQAVGTLAGGIAHDFNNILYAMMGYVQMARDDVDKESVIHRNLGKVIEAGKRGQKLISSILSFSRQQSQQDIRQMNLVTMLERVFELLTPTIPTSIKIEKNITLAKADIMGDAGQLEQVMVNIINNAVDAMDGRGLLKINLTMARFRPAYCISIEDNGAGMSEETKQRMFDPFYTTKAVDKGTGLGLSMAHGIIRDHQGNIHVDSELGKGTTFSIYLPKLEATNKGE